MASHGKKVKRGLKIQDKPERCLSSIVEITEEHWI